MRELFSKKQALLSELKNYTSDPSGTGIPVNQLLYFNNNFFSTRHNFSLFVLGKYKIAY